MATGATAGPELGSIEPAACPQRAGGVALNGASVPGLEPMHELTHHLMVAQRAVEKASAAMVRGRSHVKSLVDKGDRGFATVVDIEIERMVRTMLGQETPEIPLLGEEAGGADLAAETLWILDPIDGTANYADGSPLCAVSLALIREGRPVVGLIDAPLLGEHFAAVEGAGAFLNGARINVSPVEVGDPLVGLSDFAFGHKHAHTNRLRTALVSELVERSMRLRIHGSVALDLAWLAAGRLSGAIALSNRAWDVSAGLLLVREAGGLVFDHEGFPHGPESMSSIASVPHLKPGLIDAVDAAVTRSGQQPG